MDMSNNSKILIRGLGLWALLTLSGCATRQISGQVIDRNGQPLDRVLVKVCLLYTSPSPRDRTRSRMPSSA